MSSWATGHCIIQELQWQIMCIPALPSLYDNGSEGVSNQVARALGKSASFILCLTHFITPVFTLVSPYVELF